MESGIKLLMDRQKPNGDWEKVTFMCCYISVFVTFDVRLFEVRGYTCTMTHIHCSANQSYSMDIMCGKISRKTKCVSIIEKRDNEIELGLDQFYGVGTQI